MHPISLPHFFPWWWELGFQVTDAVLLTPFLPGWWPHNAAHSLDAPREHHVQEVHHRKWRLEPGGRVVGDLHVRETALVPAVEQRGACVVSSTKMPGGLTLKDIPGLEARKCSPVASLWLCWEQHLPMACHVPKYHGHSPNVRVWKEKSTAFADVPVILWRGDPGVIPCCSSRKLIADVAFWHPESPASFLVLFQEAFKLLSFFAHFTGTLLLVKNSSILFFFSNPFAIMSIFKHYFLVRHLTSSGPSLSFIQCHYPKWLLISVPWDSLAQKWPWFHLRPVQLKPIGIPGCGLGGFHLDKLFLHHFGEISVTWKMDMNPSS